MLLNRLNNEKTFETYFGYDEFVLCRRRLLYVLAGNDSLF